MPILMSVDNPDGAKLEELLSQVQVDLREKNAKLTGECPVNEHIRSNNLAILALLEKAESIQRDTLRRLDDLGPDQGPHGTPRV